MRSLDLGASTTPFNEPPPNFFYIPTALMHASTDGAITHTSHSLTEQYNLVTANGR